MEMARVEAEHLLPCGRVAQVVLMRSDDVAFGPDAEQFRFDCVLHPAWVDRFGEDFIQRPGQSIAGGFPVGRRILRPIGYPDVDETARASAFSQVGTNPAAGDAVADPELADRV